MLSVWKIGNAPAQQMYYEDQVARGIDDYYIGNGEAPGTWMTTQATTNMGLAGKQVTREQLMMVMDGRSPQDSLQLREKGNSPIKVAALDLVFSAPKSVSVLYALGDREMKRNLVAAHDHAVQTAFGYLEREAARVRRGKGGHEVHETSLVSAAYRHRTSRALDPQLHTHVVTANMGQGPDGRWTALHARPLYEHAKPAGAVYQAQLRRNVLKVYPQLTGGHVVEGLSELLNVPDDVLKEFSTRRQDILAEEAHLRDMGRRVGIAGRQRIAHTTRERKQNVNMARWERIIVARAAEHGFTRADIQEVLGLGAGRQLTPVSEEVLAEWLFVRGGLTEHTNTFRERDLVVAVASAHPAGLTRRQVDETIGRLLQHPEVVAIPHPGGDRYTTRDLLTAEQQILDAFTNGQSQGIGLVDPEMIDRSLAGAFEDGFALTAEQRQVLDRIVTSGNQIDIVRALAGTGKTTTANALRAVYEDQGWRVIGAGPTGRARRELNERARILGSTTLDEWALLLGPDQDIERWRRVLTRDPATRAEMPTVLVIDEAAMAPTRISSSVIRAAAAVGVKIVAIGDEGQLSSVAAGGWFGALARTHETEALSLRRVQRQYDKREIELLAQVHDGHPGEYIDWKINKQHLQVFAGDDAGLTAEAFAVQEYMRARTNPDIPVEQAVVIVADNGRRDRINVAIRDRLREQGEIGQSIRIGVGEWAVGERVISRRNDKRLDVDNGTRGTIIDVHPVKGVTIWLDTSTPETPVLRTLDPGYVKEHLEHAFALTGHGTQGGTVEWSIVVGEPWEFTKNWAYTVLSRSRQPTQIALIAGQTERPEAVEIGAAPQPEIHREDALAQLARSMEHGNDEHLATEHLDRAHKHGWEPQTSPRQADLERTVYSTVPLPPTAQEVIERLDAVVAELDEIATEWQLPVTIQARQILNIRDHINQAAAAGYVLAIRDAEAEEQQLIADLPDAAGLVVRAEYLKTRDQELRTEIRQLTETGEVLANGQLVARTRGRLRLELNTPTMLAAEELMQIRTAITQVETAVARDVDLIRSERDRAIEENTARRDEIIQALGDTIPGVISECERLITCRQLLDENGRELLEQLTTARSAGDAEREQQIYNQLGEIGQEVVNIDIRLQQPPMRLGAELTDIKFVLSITPQVAELDVQIRRNQAERDITVLRGQEREVMDRLTQTAVQDDALQGAYSADRVVSAGDVTAAAIDRYEDLGRELTNLHELQRREVGSRADLRFTVEQAKNVLPREQTQQVRPREFVDTLHQARARDRPPLFSVTQLELDRVNEQILALAAELQDPEYAIARAYMAARDELADLQVRGRLEHERGYFSRREQRERDNRRKPILESLRNRLIELEPELRHDPRRTVREEGERRTELRALNQQAIELRARAISEETLSPASGLTPALESEPLGINEFQLG